MSEQAPPSNTPPSENPPPVDGELAELRRVFGQSRTTRETGPTFGQQDDTVEDSRSPMFDLDGEPPVSQAALNLADQILGGSATTATEPSESVSTSVDGARPLLAVCRGDEETMLAPGVDIILGRGADCFAPSVDGRVSRRHAKLTIGDAGPVVVDLGSANGTVIRRTGEVVAVGGLPVEVQPGDQLVTIDDVLLAQITPVSR